MIDLLRQRRSVRKFLPRPIEEDKLAVLKEALLRSPSSRDIRPWEFIFVDDLTVLAKLARAKPHGAEFLSGAALGIVILGNETESDVWIEDCAIAAVIVQLTGLSLGLGSCWVQIRNREHDATTTAEEYVQGLLEIPRQVRVEAIVGMGYPAEVLPPTPREDLNSRKIHENIFRTG